MKKNTCFVMLAALMMAGCSNEIEEQAQLMNKYKQ